MRSPTPSMVLRLIKQYQNIIKYYEDIINNHNIPYADTQYLLEAKTKIKFLESQCEDNHYILRFDQEI